MNDAAIKSLNGPILILGGSGFVGASLFKRILAVRDDVFATAQRLPAWRLDGAPREKILATDLLIPSNLREVFDTVSPKTVFNCIAYGAYSFESDAELILKTNFMLTASLLELAEERRVSAFVHCGSSSEYGLNSNAPKEDSPTVPNSHYAVSKCGSASLITYYGAVRRLPCVNLRLYSVYGPLEDAARLIPNLIKQASSGAYPALASPDTCRDFVYIDDVTEALIKTALSLSPDLFGQSFNIGSGTSTSIRELVGIAKRTFAIPAEPEFATMANRDWDTRQWVSDPSKAEALIGWRATTSLEAGLKKMFAWYETLPAKDEYAKASKNQVLDRRFSVSAIIACYRDEPAIPYMYERLTAVFQKLGVDYEIIFVNDGSPDECERVIQEISAKDRHVIGISHARNFGSQAAFKSGMSLSRKASCVLLDGDLQDPPELIEAFVAKWREGYEVVYGRRVGRDATLLMNISYKLFYRAFNKLSYVSVPKDAGDFSLLDRQVVDWLLKFPERDLFLRGLRAFVGFKQVGVDYHRPERMFGISTNNLLKNMGWAKKGIFSFSNVPLNALTGFSLIMVLVSGLLGVLQMLLRIIWPELTPSGLTTVIVAIMAFGSLNLLALSVLGEYISKIFEEVKGRPHYIRKALIQDGQLQKTVKG